MDCDNLNDYINSIKYFCGDNITEVIYSCGHNCMMSIIDVLNNCLEQLSSINFDKSLENIINFCYIKNNIKN